MLWCDEICSLLFDQPARTLAMQPDLCYLAASPFSHRAKWALDYHGIHYNVVQYQIAPFYWMQIPLRLRLGQWRGPITAPILLLHQPARHLMDSTSIARWADQVASKEQSNSSAVAARGGDDGSELTGPRQALFPPQHAKEIDRWLTASDQLLSVFRRELSAAGLREPTIRDALMPPRLAPLLKWPGPLGALLRWLMYKIFAMLSTKFNTLDAAADPAKAATELQAASKQLATSAAGSHKYLLPQYGLSYADIALATAINKCMEVVYKKVPVSSAALQDEASVGNPTAGEDTHGAVDGCSSGSERSVISYMPKTQQLVQQHPDLVKLANVLVRQHWPDGVATLHGAD